MAVVLGSKTTEKTSLKHSQLTQAWGEHEHHAVNKRTSKNAEIGRKLRNNSNGFLQSYPALISHKLVNYDELQLWYQTNHVFAMMKINSAVCEKERNVNTIANWHSDSLLSLLCFKEKTCCKLSYLWVSILESNMLNYEIYRWRQLRSFWTWAFLITRKPQLSLDCFF